MSALVAIELVCHRHFHHTLMSADEQQCLTAQQKLHKASACLQDAEAEGCITVSGLEMFVGQAAQQFELFTGQKAPIDLMRQATLDSMAKH